MPSKERDLWITGELVTNDISIERIKGREALGTPFDYELTLLSESSKVDFSTFIGETITAHLTTDGDEPRHFNGYVTKVALVDTFDRFARYRLTVRPFIWLLSPRVNSRIFQHMSVPDIVTKLFREHGYDDAFETATSGSYPSLDYVVQYRESDFAFVSRLMEGAGIYYFFKHTEDHHKLVLADSEGAHAPAPHYATVPFRAATAGAWSVDHIDSWVMEQQLRPGAYASDDFNFEKPKLELLSQSKFKARHKKGDQEVYEYPGGFDTNADGETNVRTRLQELTKDVETVSASGDVRGLGSGHLFTLEDFPIDSQNKKYLIVNTHFEASVNAHESGGGEDLVDFRVAFEAIDSLVPFRPTRATPVPRIEGPQTAIVVGGAGEEIWTDKYGRVKVQFHWDREGKHDENSSCWVRVSQGWAGGQWGAIHTPRIGQEVVVDFLEGDPDHPIIVGRVYNGDNGVPYALPANKTQSGIKSRSSLGGGPANFNEFRFEDKKGSEHVYLHAEKDLLILVEHDERRQVGHDRVKEVTNDEATSIGGNRTETVNKNESITIDGNRDETVGKSESVSVAVARDHTIGAEESLTVGGSRTETVGASESISVGGSQSVSVGGSQSTTVGGSQSVDVAKNQSVTIGGGRSLTIAKDDTVSIDGEFKESISKNGTFTVGKKLLIDAADELTIKSGDASIILKKNGDITIKGKNISLDGSGKINVKASGDVIVKGSKISGN